MRDCETIRESIGRWLDRELDAAESESVRTHLASCEECRKTQQQLESIQQILEKALLVEAQQIEFLPFWRGVQLRIAQKTSWHERALTWARATFTLSRAAWLVPASIAVILAILSLESYIPGWREGRNSFASVESIDAYGRNVALLRENESKTTVIWLYEDQEAENETADESAKSAPAF
ncbi:MAG TPA: zf-HC2 domain-containing protein [Candidatus Binatia bacterium]|nr:zf-HC2 domain-containing protein [Candidatus Binatia bacterium]